MKGLVLGGGGSKGAYEVGAWKALNELEMQFDVVTGTSIGALNGVLYVQQDYEACKALWDSLSLDKVINGEFPENFDIDSFMEEPNKYKEFISAYVKEKGADIAPLEQLVRGLYDEKRFYNSPIDYGCMRVNVSKLKADPITKKEMKADEVVDHILASASCFPAFPMRKIHDDVFIDGGYSDNVPIELAKSLGATSIVAFNLKGSNHPYMKPSDELVYIQPYRTLGSFLDFHQEIIQKNILVGYNDTMKAFHKRMGYQYTFPLSEEDIIASKLETINKQFKDERSVGYMSSILDAFHSLQEKTTRKIYVDFPYPELRMLEVAADVLGIDDMPTYTFEQFLNEMYTIVEDTTSTFTSRVKETNSVKEVVDILKDETLSANLLIYVYQLIQSGYFDDNKKISTFVSALPESFYTMYMLYSLKSIGEPK